MSLRSDAAKDPSSKGKESSQPSSKQPPQASMLSSFRPRNLILTVEIGQEKQKKLLESNAGHFSMLKALHMADYITALNGKSVFIYTTIRRGALPSSHDFPCMGPACML